MPDKIITELQIVACAGRFAGVGGMLHYLLKVQEGKAFSWRNVLFLQTMVTSWQSCAKEVLYV